MRIKKLELKNFRGFEDLTIDFPEGESGLAVFVGVNGSGKTSVIEGIVSLLNTFLLDLTKPERKGKPLSKTYVPIDGRDVRIDAEKCDLFLSIEYLGIDTKVDNSIYASGGSLRLRSGDYIDYQKNNIEEIRSNLYKNLWVKAPVICHYPPDRVVGKPTLKIIDIESTKPWNIYEGSLDSKINYSSFFDWVRSTEDYENEQWRFGDKNYRHFGLDAVREVVQKFIPGVKTFRVQRQPKEEFLIEKDGKELPFDKLSTGERGLIALVADIVRRISIANQRSVDLFESKGVVLIDEIEQHLHPKWQRDIIKNLRDTFPNIQFILTTHSPQVISTLHRENVFILDNFQLVKETPHTYGRDSNSILYDIFGIEKRPAEAKEEFAKLYRLMDDPEKVDETANLLHDVEAKYGYYDEEVVRARGQFQFLNEA